MSELRLLMQAILFMGVGVVLTVLGVVLTDPSRALLWIAGPLFFGIGVFVVFLVLRLRRSAEDGKTATESRDSGPEGQAG